MFWILIRKFFALFRTKPPEASIFAGSQKDGQSASPQRRDAHIVQIGLDFGTAFSKCICRDITKDKAWIYIPPSFNNYDFPFLIPSLLVLNNSMLQHVQDQNIHYPEKGLYHLKQAMVAIALGRDQDPVLEPYKHAMQESNKTDLPGLVESCAVYLFAITLGMVKEDIRKRLPGFGDHPEDYLAVNIAVPVAEAQEKEVADFFGNVVCEALSLVDELKEKYPAIKLEELIRIRKNNQQSQSPAIREACYIYPEVSANVQGFVRSRVASPDIYLFSDTGAGTVDQSTFIFYHESDNTERLNFLYGQVLPLGAGRIDFLAAESSGKLDPCHLEAIRQKREQGSKDQAILQAKNNVGEDLKKGTVKTLAQTKGKMINQDNIHEIKVIFGGGGHCEHPYERCVVREPFSHSLFREPIAPPVVGLPIPPDLTFDGQNESTQRRWMRRLNVAYGLSFLKDDLVSFTYPKDIEAPDPEEIWPRIRKILDAVSKDEC